MAYGLKYYFVDKKLVGSTTSEYKFEILEDGYAGSATEWTGVEITRNYDQISYRNINPFQKSSCTGTIRVENATQRGVIETIAGSEQGDYKVQLKKNNNLLWTGLVVPELTVIGEQNYGNQTANIVAKDIFLSGDFPLATVGSGDTEKAIVIIADILDTLGYGLPIVTFTSWIDSTLTQTDDILNQAYHELERFRVYSTNATEEPRALSNEQALFYMLTAYGLILRQVDGEWQLIQITAYKNLSSVGSWAYYSNGSQYAGSRGQTITPETPGSDLFVLGGTSNNYFAGVKTVKSKFQHESTIQGIKFNPEYWIDDGSTLSKSQFWQADGTGNLEISFVHWFAKTTSTDLGNPNTLDVRIYVDTGGASDYYWDGSSWTTTPSTIDIDVEETYSTTDSDGNYVHKGEPFSIVTDPIPDLADGTLIVEFDPDELQPNYAYWYLRDLRFNLTYSDEIVGTSFAIDFELTQSGSYSEVYDVGTYYFGEGPTSASLSAIKDSTGDLLASWKRYADGTTITHQQLLLNEILHVRRTPKRNIRATLYGEFEPDTILLYDSTNFFFLGGSWNSKSYQWSASFTDITYSEASDTLNTFYLTDGSGISSGAVGSSGSSSTTTPTNALLKANNLSDVASASTSRDNLDLGTSDTPEFAGATLTGQLTSADIIPVTDDTEFLGGASNRWRVLYATRIRTDILREADGTNVLGMTSTTRDLYGLDGSVRISFEDDVVITNGNVGINTSTPGQFLEIKETSNGAGDAVIRLRGHGNNADNTILGALEWWNADSSGDQPGVVARVEAVSGNSNGHMGELVFKTHDGSEGGEGSDPVERMRIDNSGNVSIVNSLTLGDSSSVDGYLYITNSNPSTATIFLNNLAGNPRLDIDTDTYIDTDLTVNIDLKVDGATDLNSTLNVQGNLTTQADVADDGFTSGWTGTNWRIEADGSAELNELRVRGSLRVYEFIAKQISTIGGSEILTIAQGKVESIATSPNRITIDNVGGSTTTSFVANDLWVVQSVDINTGTVVKVHGRVDSVANNVLTVTVLSGTFSNIEQGNSIFAYGNISDATRRNIMYRNVDESEDNLIMRLQTDIDSYGDLTNVANTRVAFGDLNGYSGLASRTYGFFAGDNSAEHILITESGLFLKDGSTTLARLSSNTFKVGDSTNFVSFDGTNFDIESDTFTLDATTASGGLKIDSTTQLIQLEDDTRVRTQIDINTGSPSVTETTRINQVAGLTIVQGTPQNTVIVNVPSGDSMLISVSAELDTLGTGPATSPSAYIIVDVYGGTTSGSATNLIATFLGSDCTTVGDISEVEFSAYSYDYDYIKLQISVFSNSTPGPAEFITDTNIVLKSYTSQTRLSLDGLFVNSSNSQYARLTREANILSGIVKLPNIPTVRPSTTGIVYSDGGTLKIS